MIRCPFRSQSSARSTPEYAKATKFSRSKVAWTIRLVSSEVEGARISTRLDHDSGQVSPKASKARSAEARISPAESASSGWETNRKCSLSRVMIGPSSHSFRPEYSVSSSRPVSEPTFHSSPRRTKVRYRSSSAGSRSYSRIRYRSST
jgi:hypothetical protein